MKKALYIVSLITVFGCSNFLDEVDQDKIIPEKTDHYSALLLQEFNYEYPIFKTVDYMTDNVVEDPKAATNSKFGFKTTYTWQREIEIDENGNRINNINSSWADMYEDIAIANYVIVQIDDAIGTPEEIASVKGEAYFIRALSYFNLLNLYGQPYNTATANVDLGVPLRENIGIETTYNRNTVAECYSFIEDDLTKATELLAQSGITKSKWHPSVTVCNLLMSRIKLYQEKWDDAIDFADLVINTGSLTKMTATNPFITASNSEVLYSYYATNPLFQLYNPSSTSSSLSTVYYRVNPEFYTMYDNADLRKQAYFFAVDDGTGKLYYRTKKYQLGLYTSLGYANFRVSEAYLNRAEAYAHKEDYTNALNDIKALHAKRYSDVAGIVYPTDNATVLPYILKERRKELCFEDHHRWYDLRRMKNRPEIKHVFTLIDDNGGYVGKETYTLLPYDFNYTLSIPLKERENNPLIRDNERYEKIPVIE